MEKDLLKEIGIDEEEEEEEENDDEEISEQCKNIDDLTDRINDMQLEVENAVKESFDVSTRQTFLNILNNESKCSEKENNRENECEQSNRNITVEHFKNDKEHDENKLSDISDVESEATYIDDYDTRSIRSTSTAATIAPDVIKRRMKLALQKREKKGQSKKCLVKGEASAVTRTRRDNNAVIKESTGIWE